eukprot:gene43902-58529_t
MCGVPRVRFLALRPLTSQRLTGRMVAPVQGAASIIPCGALRPRLDRGLADAGGAGTGSGAAARPATPFRRRNPFSDRPPGMALICAVPLAWQLRRGPAYGYSGPSGRRCGVSVRGRPRGGVVTQRTANPCTPVRFRAWPPKEPEAPASATLLIALALPAPAPPDHQPSATSAHCRDVDGQDNKANRHHPEAEDGQEAEDPTCDKSGADSNPRGARTRQMDFAATDLDAMPGHGLS